MMKPKYCTALLLAFFLSSLLHAQSIELALSATPFNFDKNDRTYTAYSNNNSSSFHDHSTNTYYNFSPEISLVNKRQNQTNFRLAFSSSSYKWNSYYTHENYTLSKSQRYFGGMEIGQAKRITMDRLLLLPEVFLGFSTSIYQQYNGSNVSKTAGNEYLVTYNVTSPNKYNLQAGFQQSFYYSFKSKFYLGLQFRITGNLTIVNGQEVYVREDKYDNLHGDETTITQINSTLIRQISSLGISFRYKIK